MDPEALKNAGLNATNLDHLLPDLSVRDILKYIYASNIAVGASSEDRFPAYHALSNSMGIISAVLVFFRVLFKLVTGGFGMDDIYLVLTIVIGAFNTVNSSRGVGGHGLGKHVWVLGGDLNNLDAFLEYFLALTAVYFALVMLIKVAFLAFFLRIFPSEDTRMDLRITTIVVAAYGVTFVLVGGLQCYPVEFYWQGWDGEHTGACVDRDLVAWANAVLSIGLDIWIIYIPLREIANTTLDMWKKITGGFMLSLGLIMTIVSVVRFVFLIRFKADDVDPTWNYLDICVWSTIEIHVGIWCLCVPTIRAVTLCAQKKWYKWKHGGGSQTSGCNDNNDSNGDNDNNGHRGSHARELATTKDGRNQPCSSETNLVSPQGFHLQDLSGYYSPRHNSRRESRRTEDSGMDKSTILAPPTQIGDPTRD